MATELVTKGFRIAKASTLPPDDVSKETAEMESERLSKRLLELTGKLAAVKSHGLLVILQGMDAAGKDGGIRALCRGLNPVDTSVVSFKVPTDLEVRHDFLWRAHAHIPARGQIAIFNRSYYEDLILPRARESSPSLNIERRTAHIRNFEDLLADSGVIVVKLFLHISKEEQIERLEAREHDPAKAWKLAAGDWEDRKKWDNFLAAYESSLRETSTKLCPWYAVPADKKWYRNLCMLLTATAALTPFESEWNSALAKIRAKKLKELRDAGVKVTRESSRPLRRQVPAE